MRRKYSSFILMILIVFMVSACGAQAPKDAEDEPADHGTMDESGAENERENLLEEVQGRENSDEEQMQVIAIEIDGQSFQASLYDNETARELAARLPMKVNMDEMNGNEKYYFMDQALPAASESVGSIRTGDIMLYGSDCLVLFFEDFSTSYSYTRIGRIDDPKGFADALADGTVEVSFREGE